jgi:hypothetical protein
VHEDVVESESRSIKRTGNREGLIFVQEKGASILFDGRCVVIPSTITMIFARPPRRIERPEDEAADGLVDAGISPGFDGCDLGSM